AARDRSGHGDGLDRVRERVGASGRRGDRARGGGPRRDAGAGERRRARTLGARQGRGLRAVLGAGGDPRRRHRLQSAVSADGADRDAGARGQPVRPARSARRRRGRAEGHPAHRRRGAAAAAARRRARAGDRGGRSGARRRRPHGEGELHWRPDEARPRRRRALRRGENPVMPARLVIEGGVPLRGRVAVGAAKNATLPALAAALLTSEPVTLTNVPDLGDIRTMLRLLETHGAAVARDGRRVEVRVPRVANDEASYELVSTMRASVLVLGPLVARHGSARVALPGGCAIGVRPIDQHLKGLAKLGADIAIENGYVVARARRLRGARITTDLVTVPAKLDECGVDRDVGPAWVRVRGPARPGAADVTTSPFPGFPTDMQAQLMTLLGLADGQSRVTETIFENRFMHAAELVRLG